MDEKQRCAGVFYEGPFMRNCRCSRNGKYEHDGKLYCKQHHPPTVTVKNNERKERREAQWAASEKTQNRTRAEQVALAGIRNPAAVPRVIEEVREVVRLGILGAGRTPDKLEEALAALDEEQGER